MNEQDTISQQEILAAEGAANTLPSADLSEVEARVEANLSLPDPDTACLTGRAPAGLQVTRVDTQDGLPHGNLVTAAEPCAELPVLECQDYVVGYAFSPQGTEVALIEKLRPDWQVGKYNGIGGKVERGETRAHAMSREFGEEAGVYISADRWLHFRTEEFYPNADTSIWVHHFAVMTSAAEWDAIHTAEEEKVVKLPYPLPAEEDRNLVYNMPYLVPMAYVLLHTPPERRPAP